MYELVNSAEFAACVTGYGTAVSAGASPSAFPSPVDKPISDPPFAPLGDALTFRTFPETWYDGNGVAHGPQTDVDAVLLVGRTVTFIGTVTDGEGGSGVEHGRREFRLALERVVERANAALAGTPIT